MLYVQLFWAHCCKNIYKWLSDPCCIPLCNSARISCPTCCSSACMSAEMLPDFNHVTDRGNLLSARSKGAHLSGGFNAGLVCVVPHLLPRKPKAIPNTIGGLQSVPYKNFAKFGFFRAAIPGLDCSNSALNRHQSHTKPSEQWATLLTICSHNSLHQN